jgi:hypothetical protein
MKKTFENIRVCIPLQCLVNVTSKYIDVIITSKYIDVIIVLSSGVLKINAVL